MGKAVSEERSRVQSAAKLLGKELSARSLPGRKIKNPDYSMAVGR
jgi:hypothetical protein